MKYELFSAPEAESFFRVGRKNLLKMCVLTSKCSFTTHTNRTCTHNSNGSSTATKTGCVFSVDVFIYLLTYVTLYIEFGAVQCINLDTDVCRKCGVKCILFVNVCTYTKNLNKNFLPTLNSPCDDFSFGLVQLFVLL